MSVRGKWWLSLVVLLIAPAVRADWPMYRHDAQRTAEGTRSSQLATPAIAWRYYLGGAVRQLLPLDVDHDGVPEVLYTSGGILFTKRSDDSVVWQTPVLGLSRIAGVADLDGDGVQDVVAVGTPGLLAVFRASDGTLEWQAAAGQFGANVGVVRLADFNGDGLSEIYAADAGCGNPGSLPGGVGHAYTFGGGFGSPNTLLWSLETGRDYACGQADVVTDLDGDGEPEVIAFSSTLAWVFDGHTGLKISSGNTANLGGYDLGFSLPYGVLTAEAEDLDGTGHNTIVGYTNNPYAPSINSRSVFVMAWDATHTIDQRFFVRWRHDVASVTDDTHVFIPNGAMDLDGDGRMEVSSTFVSGSTATTSVYRGSDGTVLSQVNGTISGMYRLSSSQPPTLVVSLGGNLVGYQFPALPTTAVPTPAWTLPSATPVSFFDIAQQQQGQVTLPNAGGLARVVVTTASGHLQSWDVSGTPSLAADVDMMGLTVTGAIGEQNIDEPGPGLLVGRSDGLVLVLDPSLQILNTGSATVALTGIRTGGYYANSCVSPLGPVAARVNGMYDTVFASDSRGMLLRLDPAGASVVQAPRIEWSWARARTPLLVDLNNDAIPDLVAQVRDPATDTTLGLTRTLTARFSAGSATSWSTVVPAAPRESFQWDVVPHRVTGGPSPRLSVSTIDEGNGNGRVYVLGPDGSPVFSTAPLLTVASSQGSAAAVDANHDGQDDVMIDMAGILRVYSGVDGTSLGQADSMAFAEITTVLPSGAVPGIDVLAPSSVVGLQGYGVTSSASLHAVWQHDALRSTTYCGGATVQCPTSRRFAVIRNNSNTLTVVDAATGATAYEVSLAHGAIGAATDGGLLADVIASPLLDTQGHPQAVFLTGSSDGYLYAVDACATAPQLAWAFNLHAAVGDAILADTDGDSFDEILVEAADGYLYALDTQRFPAPAWVRDVDPPHGLPDTEVSTICGNGVYTEWADVPGALGYEWALYTVRGDPVSHAANDPTNPFIRVDATVHRGEWHDGLVAGSRYVFVVHAIGPEGNSSDTLSPGVRFTGPCPGGDAGVDAACTSLACRPDLQIEGRAGPWGRCVCSVHTFAPVHSSPARLAWGVVVATLFGARRRSRRARSA